MIFSQPIYLEFNPGASTLTLIVIAFSLLVGVLLSCVYYCFNYGFSSVEAVTGIVEDASVSMNFVSVPTAMDFSFSFAASSQTLLCKQNHVRVSAKCGEETIVYDDNVSYELYERALHKLPIQILIKRGMFDQKIKVVGLC